MKYIIFDIDGTLYRQTPVRINMALNLACYYITHPHRIRELLGIKKYRSLREDTSYAGTTGEEYIRLAAKAAGVDSDKLQTAINKWMFEKPLSAIKKSERTEITQYLIEAKANGDVLIAYSDYEPSDKLRTLSIEPDYSFSPGNGIADELKPSLAAMTDIKNITKLDTQNTVYIGDRVEKDGASAELIGVRYIDVKDFRS